MGAVRDNYSDMSAQYRPDRRFDDNNSDMSESLRSGPRQGKAGPPETVTGPTRTAARTDGGDGGQAASRTTRSRVVVRLPVAVPT